MLSDRFPVCLSVTLVYCGQTFGRIKMKLGMQVGLGPGHIVFGGDPAPPPPKGPQFLFHIICGPMAGWIKIPLGVEVGLGPGDFTLGGTPLLVPKNGAEPPKFLAHVYCGQTAGWIKMIFGMQVGVCPGDFKLDGDQPPLHIKGWSPLPNFWPISIVAKRLDASRCRLV